MASAHDTQGGVATAVWPHLRGARVISCLTTGRLSGVDVFALELTRELARRGIDARIALTEHEESVADPMTLPDDVVVDRLPIRARDNGWRRRRVMSEYLCSQAPCVYLPNYDYRHSAVVAHLPDSVVTLGILHSDDPMHYDHARRLTQYWNATVVVSRAIGERLEAVAPGRARRVERIPYGVQVREAPRARERAVGERLKLLYAGRLEQSQKRVLDLPRILDECVRRGVAVELTVIGGGEERQRLIDASRAHLEAGRMRLIDTLAHERLLATYATADVFLLTSAFEGLPVSLLEAMAAGCVPVVSDIRSGVPELVESGRNGWRVTVGDVAGFAEVLGRLERDGALLAEMSRRAYATMAGSEFTLESMVEHYARLGDELLAEVVQGAFHRPRPWPGEMMCRRVWTSTTRRVRRRWHRLWGHPAPGAM